MNISAHHFAIKVSVEEARDVWRRDTEMGASVGLLPGTSNLWSQIKTRSMNRLNWIVCNFQRKNIVISTSEWHNWIYYIIGVRLAVKIVLDRYNIKDWLIETSYNTVIRLLRASIHSSMLHQGFIHGGKLPWNSWTSPKHLRSNWIINRYSTQFHTVVFFSLR